MRHTLRFLLFILAIPPFVVPAQSQQNVVPTVTFSCDFPGSDPAHYGISVSSDGHASYISDGKLTRDSEPDEPFTLDFTMPQATLNQVFDLTRKARFFAGNVDSKKKNIASTGEKTLTYRDAQRNTSASYNYSMNPAVQELTMLFQNLSTTLEYGRRIEYDHRYQKLALDEELKRMDDASSRGGLSDVVVIATVLKKVLEDPSVVNTARARAQRLLEHAGTASK